MDDGIPIFAWDDLIDFIDENEIDLNKSKKSSPKKGDKLSGDMGWRTQQYLNIQS